MSKTAQAIKWGGDGGTAILSAVNGLTPHMAGAIDIMVVQQPDGSLKCSPFYVRFGKYTPMRSKDKKVQIFVNGEEACFNMHLGAYGQAYFAAETMEIVSDADDELLTGMMSPSSGYSSDDDDSSTPYANASMLSAVQQEVQRLKAAQAAADAQEAAAAGTPSATAAAAAAAEPGAGLSGAGGRVPEPGSVDEASGVQAEASGSVSAAGGGVQGLEVSSSSGPRPSQGSTLSGSESDEESSSSSSSFSDLPSPAEVAQALRQGLEAGAGHHSVITNTAHNGADGYQQHQQQELAIPPGLAPIATVSSNGNTSGSGSSKRRSRKHHLAKRVLQVSGDGAAGDPARSHLQDLLLGNKYSFKMQSDASFVAAGRQPDADAAAAAAAEPQQQRSRSRSPLQHSRHTRQEQQHHQQQPQTQAVQQLEDTHPQQQQQQQQVVPVRHVGFQLPSSPEQSPSNKSIGPAARAAAAAGAAASNGHLPRVHASDLPVLLDSAASYSVDEVSEATGASRTASTTADADSSGVVDGPAAAAAEETVAAAAAGESPFIASRSASMEPQPTLADGLQDAGAGVTSQALPGAPRGQPLDFPMGQRQPRQQQLQLQQQGEEGEGDSEGVISPGRGRDSLLSSSLKAQQQQQQKQQEQQQEEQQVNLQQEQHSVHQRLAELQSVQPSLPQQQDRQQQMQLETQQQRPQVAEQQTRVGALSATSADATTAAAATAAPPAAAAAAAGGEAGDGEVDRSPSAASSQDVDATAILDEPAAVATTDWATTQAVPPPPPAAAEAGTPPADVPTTPAAVRSDPVSMPAPFATSPPVDSGYLGDSEAGALLGTSYETATPRRGAAAAAAAAMSAEGVSGLGAGPLALGLVGFQLSLCGDLLRPGIAAAEAQQVFETRRVSGEVWCERGVSLMADPNLVVRIGGSLYSWQVAAPMVVGMLAFGGKWDNLLGLDDTGLYPIKVAEDHTGHTAKKSSSSWRLWPFTGWREPSGSSSRQQPGGQQQQQVVPGTSPVAGPLAPAAAAASGSASAALQPSGGSFNNLRALLGPGSKSAPGRAGDYSGAGAGGADGSVGGVVGVDGAAGRTGSFMSTGSSPPRVSRKKHIILIRKTLTPTSDQLSLLPLKPGANTITFRAGGAADLTAYIYLLRWNTRLVVSDVDGTITRSDLLGHVLPTLGVDWSHPGITQLFHNIARNGYQIMFLSSRAIAQANITREYLHTLVQNDFKMPSGPVIISPHGLLPSLYREIVVRRPHEFKIACLQDIRALFPTEWNPFYAGFGNRDTDEVAYREVGVPLSRTFTINPKGQIQKASTAVQSSTWSSLSAINDLVDEMFPGLLQHSSSSLYTRGLQSVYTSFNDTLELAAAIGAIEHEAAAALFAEQQRRRSSSSGGGAADGAKARAAGSAAADGSNGGQHLVGADGLAAAAAADGDSGGGVVGGGLLGPPLTPENVGPAREEYNDLHFWRPSLSVDIQDELAEFTVKQTQPVS